MLSPRVFVITKLESWTKMISIYSWAPVAAELGKTIAGRKAIPIVGQLGEQGSRHFAAITAQWRRLSGALKLEYDYREVWGEGGSRRGMAGASKRKYSRCGGCRCATLLT